MANIMKKAGVNFGILGIEEGCCGDPARRIGNEYLFQMLAQTNIETFNSYGIKKIVTACPHCFNTIKNEYPDMGGNYEVLHSTEFILQLIKEGKLSISKGMDITVTYHDSCYLGRHNDRYDPPREILKVIPNINIIEMKRNKDRGLCCGAGGGRMWMEEKIGTRMNENRLEDVLEINPQALTVACPFCMTMLEDAIKVKELEDSLKTYDIVEIVNNVL
jgi:Fe-S oxidoreductase